MSPHPDPLAPGEGKPEGPEGPGGAGKRARRRRDGGGGAGDGPFGRHATILLVAGMAISFAVGIGLSIVGREIEPVVSAEPDGFSRSALGHAAFVRLLRELDIPVVVSRTPALDRRIAKAVVVVAEPKLDELRRRPGLLEGKARAILLVLPKRQGAPDPSRQTWLESADLRPASDADAVLAEAGIGGGVGRREAGAPRIAYATGRFRSAPTLERAQLYRGGDLVPIVAAPGGDGGVVVGELPAPELRNRGGPQRLVVLADPDLISTHGLEDGDNAALAVELIEDLRGDDGVVIFDETVHGHEVEQSIWKELFDFPLVLSVIQAALAAAALLWAGLRRFGSPLPAAAAVAPGKEQLIDNTAALLRFAGHSGHALSRYLGTIVREAAEALHAPEGLAPKDLRAWLDRVGAARGVPTRLADLDVRVASAAQARGRGRAGAEPGAAGAHAIISAARRIHRWRREILHGRAVHP